MATLNRTFRSVVPKTPLFDEPRSLFSVLLEGWEKASGLRGYPDNLKINRHIANAYPHLQSSLGHIGDIALVVADGKDKQFSVSLRVAQQGGLELGWRNGDGHVINDVKELNDHAMNIHNEHINSRLWEMHSTKSVKERASEWMGLPFNASNAVLDSSKLDWVGLAAPGFPHGNQMFHKIRKCISGGMR